MDKCSLETVIIIPFQLTLKSQFNHFLLALDVYFIQIKLI